MPTTPEIDAVYIQIALRNKEAFERHVAETAAKVKQYAASMKADLGTVGQGLKDAGYSSKSVDAAVKSLQQIEPATAKASKGLWSLNNVARTALGTMTAMGIFLVTQFVGNAITKTIDSLKQLELAIFKLTTAERALSNMGVDITPQQLQAITAKVTGAYETVSGIDAMKMLSNLALLTKDLKLTADQYEKIAMAIPILAQQADISIESATDQIVTGLTKSGRGWADLGIQVDAAVIRQKAVAAGLVESETAYNNLTAEQKQQVEVLSLIEILQESTNDGLKSQAEYLDTVAGKQAKANALMEENATLAGTLFSPVVRVGGDMMIRLLEMLRAALTLTKFSYIGMMSVMVGGFFTLQDLIQGNIKSMDDFSSALVRNMHNAKVQLESYITPTLGSDTPTNPNPGTDGEGEAAGGDKLQEALDKAREEILQAQQKLEQDLVDAEIDLQRKLQDIDSEYFDKRAGAWRDYQDKVADINRDFNDKIEDINREYNEQLEKLQQEADDRRREAKDKELEKEKEFQNKMLELKENFLMSLEDALHARDARQVLKLIAQYELDKTQAQRRHDLEMEEDRRQRIRDEIRIRREIKQAEKDRQRKIEEAELERQRKLRDAELDYQQKLAQLKREEDAEVASARLADKRKREDLIRGMKDRLALMAAELVTQYKLSKEGLDKILELFRAYYGDGGFLSQIMSGMLSRLQSSTVVDTGGLGGSQDDPRRGRGYSSANLGSVGRTVNIPSMASGFGANLATTAFSESSTGKLTVELWVSPELEGRIVDNTLNKAATIIQRVQRSR